MVLTDVALNTLSLHSSPWSHVHWLFHKMHCRLHSIDSWIWSIQCVYCSPAPLLGQKQIRTNPIRHQSSHLLTIWSVAHTTCPLPLWHTDSSPLRPAVEGRARCNSYKQCTLIQEWGEESIFWAQTWFCLFIQCPWLSALLELLKRWFRRIREVCFFFFWFANLWSKTLCKEEERS